MLRGRKKRAGVNESDLTKGELRKLNALRKSLGDDIAERAFAEWMKDQPAGGNGSVDKNATVIANALQPLIETGKLRVPRGGYILRRGRVRVILERPEGE